MFELITQSMLFLLQSLKTIVGDYGWAIIALTLLVRIALWPVSRSQMKSMKMMQELQPKMKQIQERYKSDPQKMQLEMMKLYKDYKFNPLGGCLPMLIQLPVFLGLYWAVSHPTFMTSGDPVFLNFIHLNHTGIISHAGLSHDGKMNLAAEGGGGFFGAGKDHLVAGPTMKITLKNGNILEQKVHNTNEVLTVVPKEPRAGVPLRLISSYGRLKLEGYEGLVDTIEMSVLNNATKEAETVVFKPSGEKASFRTSLDTVAGKTVPNFDVLILVVLFAASMLLSQKAMTAQTASTGSEQQQQMMKMMPIMFSVFLFIFPIPAGVLLYMDTNSLFQLFQTWFFQRGDKKDASGSPPSQTILDIKPDPQS